MPRLPLLALLAVLAGSFAFHAYRAEHPTTSYQSADERSYGKLAVDDRRQPHLRRRPEGPAALAAGRAVRCSRPRTRLFRQRAERRDATTSPPPTGCRRWSRSGPRWPRFGIAALLAGAWAGVAAAALVGLYPPLILATGEQISEPLGAFWLTLAFLLFVVAARRGGRGCSPPAGSRSAPRC